VYLCVYLSICKFCLPAFYMAVIMDYTFWKEERGLVLLGEGGEKGVKMAVKGFLIFRAYYMHNVIR